MRFVAVCGGRTFDDYDWLHAVLTEHTVARDVIVHGDATGADRMAGQYARLWGLFEVAVPAQWDRMGRAAGPLRNAVIASLPLDLLIAFPGGKGTDDMIDKALAKRVAVLRPSK